MATSYPEMTVAYSEMTAAGGIVSGSPSAPVLAPLSSSVVAAAHNPAHPAFHFSLGQVLATVLLGSMDALGAYSNQADMGPAISNFVSGFMNIWGVKT